MIKTVLQWLALFTGALILQTSFIPSIGIVGIKPDLLIIALFIFSMRFNSMAGTIVGFFLGLCQDLYAPAVLGQNALATTVTGFFIGLFNEKVMRTDPMLKTLILLAAFVVHDTLFTGVTVVRSHTGWGLLFSSLLVQTVPRAIYSMLFVALLYIWEFFFKPSTFHS